MLFLDQENQWTKFHIVKLISQFWNNLYILKAVIIVKEKRLVFFVINIQEACFHQCEGEACLPYWLLKSSQ